MATQIPTGELLFRIQRDIQSNFWLHQECVFMLGEPGEFFELGEWERRKEYVREHGWRVYAEEYA